MSEICLLQDVSHEQDPILILQIVPVEFSRTETLAVLLAFIEDYSKLPEAWQVYSPRADQFLFTGGLG